MTVTELVDLYLGDTKLTPAQKNELYNLARGKSVKESAPQTNISEETVRARRKQIYRRINVDGHLDLLSKLLALAVSKVPNGDSVSGV